MAVYFIRPVLPEASATVILALVALAVGLHLGWLDKTKAGFRTFEWIKTLAGIGGRIDNLSYLAVAGTKPWSCL
jgi:thiol:disulfide interchange protein DsbD